MKTMKQKTNICIFASILVGTAVQGGILDDSTTQLANAEVEIDLAESQGKTVDVLRVRAAAVEQGIRVGELSEGVYTDVFANASNYLATAAPALFSDAEAAADDPDYAGFAIPRPDLQQAWVVSNGTVYVGSHPVALHGWVWLDDQSDPAYQPEEFAVNMQGFNSGPRLFMPNSWTIEPTALVGVHSTELQNAQAANEVIDLLLTPHYQPDWFLALPAIDNEFTDWHRYNGWWINTYEGYTLMDRFYSAVASNHGTYTSLKTVDLSNEWVFYDSSATALSAFRTWLGQEHGTIGELNQHWGTSFTAFSEVPDPSPSRQILDSYNPIVPEGIFRQRAPSWDWNRFNTTRSAQTIQTMHSMVKGYLPNVLTHNKSIFTSWSHRDMAKNFIMGCDPQKLNAVTDLVGTDGSHVAGNEWKQVLFTYDYFKSLHPEKPIFSSEWHAYPYEGDGAAVMRRGKYQYAVHGERLNLLTWNVTTAQPTWFGPAGSYPFMQIPRVPEAMDLFAQTAAEMRRLTPELIRFAQREDDLLIFYDNAADFVAPDTGDGGAFGWRCVDLHTSLLPYDIKPGVLTETMLDESIPTQPLIVLAGAQYVSDETVTNLSTYLAQGGHILWMGDNLGYDHYGAVRDAQTIAAITSSPNVIATALSPNLSTFWPGILSQVAVNGPFAANVSGGTRDDLECLSTEDADGQPLIFLANTGSSTLTLALTPTLENPLDLITGETINPASIQLAPNDVVMLVKDERGLISTTTNSIPYSESFESYEPGFELAGRYGWSAASPDAAVVSTNSAMIAALTNQYSAGFPIDTTHAKVLRTVSDVTNAIDSGSTDIVKVDCLLAVDPASSGQTPELPVDEQTALWVDDSGRINMLHADTDNGSDFTVEWLALTNGPVIGDNEWMRVTVLLNYTNHMFQLRINDGLPISDSKGWNADASAQPGTWFYMADRTRSALGHTTLSGQTWLEDLVVEESAVFQLVLSAGANGGVSPENGPYISGTTVDVTATPDSYYHFFLWSGDTGAISSGTTGDAEITVTMNSNINLAAAFDADITSGGVPHIWMVNANPAWTSNFETVAADDYDGDGIITGGEYVSGTDPTSTTSVFVVTMDAIPAGAEFSLSTILSDISGKNRHYGVDTATDLDGTWDWATGYSNILGQGQTIIYTNTAGESVFVRGQVWLE